MEKTKRCFFVLGVPRPCDAWQLAFSACSAWDTSMLESFGSCLIELFGTLSNVQDFVGMLWYDNSILMKPPLLES